MCDNMDRRVGESAARRAQSALGSSSVYDLRKLRVECVGESLLIRGRVSSFYHKQLAQELVRGVAPGAAVVNTVDVN